MDTTLISNPKYDSLEATNSDFKGLRMCYTVCIHLRVASSVILIDFLPICSLHQTGEHLVHEGAAEATRCRQYSYRCEGCSPGRQVNSHFPVPINNTADLFYSEGAERTINASVL
jgi:hypothetical protein